VTGAVRGATRNQQRGGGEGPLHEQQRQLAEQLLEEAKTGPPNHDTALTLLAADTLITFACEAVAERDPGALADLR
jgi:hypothetical protein